MRQLEVYGPFWKLLEVSQSYEMLELGVEQPGCVSHVYRYSWIILSGKIWSKCDAAIANNPFF